MNNKFQVISEWKEYNLHITNEYGFNQLSISDFVKDTKDIFLEKEYKKILDLGCGSGRNTFYFNNSGFNVYASDIDCSRIKNNIKLLNLKDINVCKHSFTNIPYDNEFFDAIICTSTLHHATLDEIKKGISEIYRVLKTKGCFIFDILSDQDDSYGIGTQIESNTFVGGREGEEEIPHHYVDEVTLELLLNTFTYEEAKKSIYNFSDFKGNSYTSKCFDVVAFK